MGGGVTTKSNDWSWVFIYRTCLYVIQQHRNTFAFTYFVHNDVVGRSVKKERST